MDDVTRKTAENYKLLQFTDQDSLLALRQQQTVNFQPGDDLTNPWMYAVVISGTMFVIFVITVLYRLCRRRDYDYHERMTSSPHHHSASRGLLGRQASTFYSTNDAATPSCQSRDRCVGGVTSKTLPAQYADDFV